MSLKGAEYLADFNAWLLQTLQLWKHVCEGVKRPKMTSKAEGGDKSTGKGGIGRSSSTLPPRPASGCDADGAAPDASVDGRKTAGLREDDCEYRLYACILHKGQSQSRGHYYAMCRSGSSDEDW